MKLHAIIIIICLFFLSCKEKKAANDWGKMDLHGKVKMLVEKDYFLDTTGKDKGKELRWTKTYQFDSAGRLMAQRDLGEHGELRFKDSFIYDRAGRLIEERHYDNDTTTITPRQIIYSYNKDGLVVSVKNIDPSLGFDPETIKKHLLSSTATVYTASETMKVYNMRRQLIEEVTHYAPDTRSSTIYLLDSIVAWYTCDQNNNKVKSITTDRNGFRQTTTYSYDKTGNCILEQADTAKEHDEIKTGRKFDEHGNETEETSYEADGSIHSQKKIEYKSFDKAGNWLVQYIHWKDLGTTVVERSIEYYP